MSHIRSIQQMSLQEFETMFPNEEACCAYLVVCRWPDGIRCPRCGSERVRAAMNMKWKWKCLDCRRGGEYRFSHVAGTFFENTKAPLRSWFRILHAILRVQQLLLQDEPVSALQVQRYLRMTCDWPYHAVWGLCQRLNEARQDPEFCALMDIEPVQGDRLAAHHPSNYRDEATAVLFPG